MRILIALVTSALLLQAPARAADSPFADLAPSIEKNLSQAVIAFWYPKSIDREDGGYLIDFDAHGAFKGEGPKMIVTQARMLWLSSRLIREGRGGGQMREAARQGYRFLMDHMWDREHGGFYWEVDRAGRRVVAPHKHLYGQAFGLYALSDTRAPPAMRRRWPTRVVSSISWRRRRTTRRMAATWSSSRRTGGRRPRTSSRTLASRPA